MVRRLLTSFTVVGRLMTSLTVVGRLLTEIMLLTQSSNQRLDKLRHDAVTVNLQVNVMLACQ